MLKTSRDSKSGGRKITFSLPVDGTGPVSVVGNFNDWTPGAHVLAKRGASQSVSVVVPADYIAVFRYLGEGGRWFDEPEASFVDAGASVLLAPAPKPARAPRKTAAKVAEAAAAVVEKAAQVAPKKAPAKATKGVRKQAA